MTGRPSTRYGNPPPTCVEVSYRDEAMGASPFYDHLTVQLSTGRETRISVPPGMAISDLESYIRTGTTHNLQFGGQTPDGKIVPLITRRTDAVGLLIIPGHGSEIAKNRPGVLAARNAHEQQLLVDARRRGRPVLGICAGSGQIWSHFGGIFQKVHDHASRRMPCINAGGTVGYNVKMHKVLIPSSSMLAGAITDGWKRYRPSLPPLPHPPHPLPPLRNPEEFHPTVQLTVNSVHSEAASPAIIPSMLQVNATSLHDPDLASKKKQPDEHTIEGFEQSFGAPILGVQWHPEAYGVGENRSIFTYMAKAGDAYWAKQEVLRSIQYRMAYIRRRMLQSEVSEDKVSELILNFGKMSLKP